MRLAQRVRRRHRIGRPPHLSGPPADLGREVSGTADTRQASARSDGNGSGAKT